MNVDILRREQSATGVEVRALEPPAATRLHEIAVPTLVIVGGDDVPFIQENARFITERVRGSELVVFADAAHMPNLDHPDGFLDVVRAFLRRNGL
jgi:pimeloyl-ACP methyl ester carboxylesterase